VSAGNVLNAGLGFLYITALARTLSLENFGKYALLTSLLVSLAKLTDFGSNSLFVAHSITKNDHSANNFVSLKLLLLAAAFPISLIFLYIFDLFDLTTVTLFLLGLVVYAANFAMFGFFQKSENFLSIILLNSIPAIIKGITAVLILFGTLSLNHTEAFGVFTASIAPSMALYFFLPQEYRFFKVSFRNLKRLFLTTFPAGTSQLISESWSAIANGIAKVAQGFSEVGIYSLADKISNVFSLISLSIFTVLLPKNARIKKDTNKYEFKETVIISVGILGLAVITIGFAKFLVPLIFGEKFQESLVLLDILIIASAITAIHTFIENYFYVQEQTKYLFMVSTGRLAVFLGTSALLVPGLGISGIAYAQLAASITALTATYYFITQSFAK
jgi:O-antigen/teichoic acid export membrane protein